MHIFVKCFAEESIKLDVKPSDTLENIKTKILGKHVPLEQRPFLNFFFGGRQLASDRTLSDYNIKTNFTLHLRLVLPTFINEKNKKTCLKADNETHTKGLVSTSTSTASMATAVATPATSSCKPQKSFDWYLIFHSVAKKNNLGNILRSCAAFRVKAVLCVGRKKNVSFFGSKGTKSHVQLIFLKTLAEARQFCVERQVHVCGVEIMKEAERVSSHPFRGNSAFVLGNEGTGLSAPEKAICDHFVYISHPGNGTASLNVCVAASIVFHHFALWARYREHPREGQKFTVQSAAPHDPAAPMAAFTRARRAQHKAVVAAEESVASESLPLSLVQDQQW